MISRGSSTVSNSLGLLGDKAFKDGFFVERAAFLLREIVGFTLERAASEVGDWVGN